MTEKRFKPHLFDDGESERYFDGIIDNENDNDIIVNYHSISNLLNAIHEENRQLKSSNMEMEDYSARLEEENQEIKEIIIDFDRSGIFWDRDSLINIVESIARILGIDLE